MPVKTFFDSYRVEQLRRQGIAAQQRQLGELGAPEPSEMRSELALVEENARLRAEVKRLSDEIERLQAIQTIANGERR